MSKKPSNKIALITGASGDIGYACVKKFLDNGYKVIAHSYKNKSRLSQLAKRKSLHLIHINGDATSQEEVKDMIKGVKSKIKHIDVVVHAAGDLIDRKKAKDMDWNFMQKVIDVNVKSAFLFTKYTLSFMKKDSSIVFISSLTARGGKGDRSSAYGLAKGAILAWSKSLANELGPKGIRVNCVTPGYIVGNFHKRYTKKSVELEHKHKNPLGRLGKPEDVAEAVFFYAQVSDGYISGTTLDVCGADYMSY